MKIAYCTIASANYLPRVHTLESSLKKYNPDAHFHILLCERPDICQNFSDEMQRTLISPRDVCANWLHMGFYYDITEYNTALKPFFLQYLIDRGYDAVFYFDPDIEIFGSLSEIEYLISQYDLVLTPHICQPMPMDGLKPGMDEVIRAGQFNLGFIGITNNEESMVTLRWWAEVCKEYCLFETRHHFFVDQFWADVFPSFIQKFYCLRDPAYNMAYWNLFQRKLVFKNGHWNADGGQLKFFHFSGLADDLTKVSRHQNRVTVSIDSDVYMLLAAYRKKIATNAWSKYDSYPYSFLRFNNERIISPKERRMYLELPSEQRQAIDNPFSLPDNIIMLWRIQQQKNRPSLYRKFRTIMHDKGFMRAIIESLRYLFKWLPH